MRLIPAAPDTYALLVRPQHEDHTLQQWFVESVVAFDADDGAAYVVGGLNRTGALVRLDEVAQREGFTIKIWQQDVGGADGAREWASRHVKVAFEDANPLDRSDPRWGRS